MTGKAVIIMGSPRKDSNTHLLVKETMRGLKDSGAEAEVFFLNDLNIKGCQSCGACQRGPTAGCAVKDDMQRICEAMEASDGIIVASPVYFSDVTSQTKMWEDRLFRYYGKGKGIFGAKKAAFIFTQNQPDEKLFLPVLGTFMSMIGMIGFQPKGHLIAADLMKGLKPMATERPEYLRAAYALGRSLLGDVQ